MVWQTLGMSSNAWRWWWCAALVGCADAPSSRGNASGVSGRPAQIVDTPLPRCDHPTPLPGALRNGLPGSGLLFRHRESPFPTDLPDDWPGDTFQGTFGAGVVAADFDRDGHIDVFLSNGGGANVLFWGRGDGTFESADVRTSGVGFWEEDTGFVSTADYDGDGDLDLLLSGWQTRRLLNNQGDRTFVDVTTQAGIAPPPGYPGASAWADFDNDGDLDLFAGNYGVPTSGYDGAEAVPSFLYVQQPDGTFVDRAPELLPTASGREGIVLHAQWDDLDLDGDLDLLQVNDFGATQGNTMLWENTGPNSPFVDRMPQTGMGTLAFPMGTELLDLDGDDEADLFFSDLGQTHLFHRADTWSWVDVRDTWAAGTPDRDSDASWSVVRLDLAGNGRPGVYVAYGPLDSDAGEPGQEVPFDPHQPDRLLLPLGFDSATTLVEADVFEQPQTGRSRGVAVADFNEDGVPDVVFNNIGGHPALLMGTCTDQRRLWVRLEVPGSPGNVHAIGAEVTVEAAGLVQRQTVHAGGPGSGSAQEPVLHFGVANATAVDRLTVRWPDGRETVIDDACVDCRLTVIAL